MGKTKLAVLLATGLITSCVGAQNAVEANIKKSLEPRLGAKIESIKETPYAGLYEVRVAGDILYTDKKGEYLVIGHVYDAKSTRDLTRERIDDINKIKFSDLPLNDAIKQVKGNGKRQSIPVQNARGKATAMAMRKVSSGQGLQDTDAGEWVK